MDFFGKLFIKSLSIPDIAEMQKKNTSKNTIIFV